MLLELEGHWVLTDPVWSDRVSPSRSDRPAAQPPGADGRCGDLPQLDAVLISHDHYDHLDTATIDCLLTHHDCPFVVPLGIGEHLSRWGVPDDRIIELDWDESHRVGGLTFTCTEARHFSGRSLGSNTTLWASWVLAGEQPPGVLRRRHRLHAGVRRDRRALRAVRADAAADRGVRRPLARRTPQPRRGDPRAPRGRRRKALLPIHWATFDLAFHEWSDPVEWLLQEADEGTLALPAPGGRVDPTAELPIDPWWRASA